MNDKLDELKCAILLLLNVLFWKKKIDRKTYNYIMPTIYGFLNKEYLLMMYKLFLVILTKESISFDEYINLHTECFYKEINLNEFQFQFEDLYFVSYYNLFL